MSRSEKKCSKRRVAVVLVDRANYGRLKPVMAAIDQHSGLELVNICSGTMVLDRFDKPYEVLEADGFTVDAKLFMELEGSIPATMAKSLGIGIVEFTGEFSRIEPDIVLVIGDRYEGLAAALAASYMNICLAHIQGGEVSGSIDECARHCISKLAHYHFPSTARAAEFLINMGERPETVFHVGCPSGDIALSLDKQLPIDIFDEGIGANVLADEPYLLVAFHPVTTSFDDGGEDVQELLLACEKSRLKVIWLWPNIDAGSDNLSRVIRKFRENYKPDWLRLIKNFSPDNYLKVLANASCAVGNSSSFVRDSSFFGTPVVLVGDRQSSREVAHNVLKAHCDANDIGKCIQTQLNHGHFPQSFLYGNGNASIQIADHLFTAEIYIQKLLGYVSIK